MPQTIDFNIPISSGKNSCFISYTREDAPRIARFVKALYNRYGYTFSGNRDTGIAAHEKFSALDWYRAVQQICPSSESEDIRQYYMNDIERENISRINAWQIENNVPY